MRFKVVILVFLIMFFIPTLCRAGEIIKDVDIGATWDFNSAYMWRAQTLVDSPVFQPGAYISYKGFSFNFWGNWDFTDADEFTELDFIWDYSTNLGLLTPGEGDIFDKINVGGGYTFYVFPNLSGDDTTHEFFTSVSLDTILSPSYTTYWDIDEGDGWYHEWGIGHTFALDPVEVETGLTMGLNVSQWGYDTSLTALDYSTAVSIPLNALINVEPFKYFTVRPHINYSMPLDSQYDHEVYGGISISIDI